MNQRSKAETFRRLHHAENLLLLPNIWNPIGARVLSQKGYPAAATASAAIAESLGYQDGEKIKFGTLCRLVEKISRSVDIPLSVDIESGYAQALPLLQKNISQLLAAGAVGINFEDSSGDGARLRSSAEQVERIRAVRESAETAGIPLVINARIDTYLRENADLPTAAHDDALRRAEAYFKAGADCVYPIGPGDRRTLEILRQGIDGPMNILGSAGAISLTEMQALGIDRVSFGPFIFRSCLKKFADIADELLAGGDFSVFAGNAFSGDECAKFLMTGNEP